MRTKWQQEKCEEPTNVRDNAVKVTRPGGSMAESGVKRFLSLYPAAFSCLWYPPACLVKDVCADGQTVNLSRHPAWSGSRAGVKDPLQTMATVHWRRGARDAKKNITKPLSLPQMLDHSIYFPPGVYLSKSTLSILRRLDQGSQVWQVKGGHVLPVIMTP